MTAMSGFPRLWAATGVDGAALVERIVQLGLERHERLRAGSRWRARRRARLLRVARPRRVRRALDPVLERRDGPQVVERVGVRGRLGGDRELHRAVGVSARP